MENKRNDDDDEMEKQELETHSVDKHRDNDLNREFERVVPRHIHVCELVLSIKPEFGSQGVQRLLQVINEAFVESEDLVGVSAEQLGVFLRKYGTGERQLFLDLGAISHSDTSSMTGIW